MAAHVPLITFVDAKIKGLDCRFLIMDHPRESNMPLVLKECQKYQVIQMVRVCEEQAESYPPDRMTELGISHADLPFPDGKPPPDEVLEQWFKIVDEGFREKHCCIAVHCVAGLGRAPLMVAVALMYFGLSSQEAVALIRSRRDGCINQRQLAWLKTYKPPKNGCTIL